MGMQNTAPQWRLKLYISSQTVFLITKRQFRELLNFWLHCSTSIKRMNQAVVSLIAFLLIAALLPKSECFSGPLPAGKRELKGKVGFCYVWVFSVVTPSAKRLVYASPGTSFTSVYYLNIVFMLCTSHLSQFCFCEVILGTISLLKYPGLRIVAGPEIIPNWVRHDPNPKCSHIFPTRT